MGFYLVMGQMTRTFCRFTKVCEVVLLRNSRSPMLLDSLRFQLSSRSSGLVVNKARFNGLI